MASIIHLKPKKVQRPKIGIIVQARMTSKRFPGKSLAELHGKPVLAHVLERARLVPTVDYVVLAVPDTDASEPMLELALGMNLNKKETKIDNFCGAEDDVLDRYYHAARFFKLSIIMRITGDCPFIDPRVCFEVLHLAEWRKLDYCSNIHPKRTYPAGLDCEVFTMDCLEAAHQLATDPYDREHVTPWMQKTKGLTIACVSQKVDMSHKNWCVDFPDDIKRLEREIKKTMRIEVNANDNKTN